MRGGPSNNQASSPFVHPGSTRDGGYDQYGSYVYNYTYVYGDDNCHSPGALKGGGAGGPHIAQIADPARTLLIAETDRTNGSGALYYGGTWENPQPAIDSSVTPRRLRFLNYYDITERHLDTTAVLYTDGHVKAVKLDALFKRANGNSCLAAFTVQDDG
jgi:prepilin-type processing-associated H-X9-DG protein